MDEVDVDDAAKRQFALDPGVELLRVWSLKLVADDEAGARNIQRRGGRRGRGDINGLARKDGWHGVPESRAGRQYRGEIEVRRAVPVEVLRPSAQRTGRERNGVVAGIEWRQRRTLVRHQVADAQRVVDARRLPGS